MATANLVKTQNFRRVKRQLSVQLSRKPMLEIFQFGRDKLEKLIIFSSAKVSAPGQWVVCLRSCLLIYRVREPLLSPLKICLIVMIILLFLSCPLRQALMSFDGWSAVSPPLSLHWADCGYSTADWWSKFTKNQKCNLHADWSGQAGGTVTVKL